METVANPVSVVWRVLVRPRTVRPVRVLAPRDAHASGSQANQPLATGWPADTDAISTLPTNAALVLLVLVTFGLLIYAHRHIGR
jgi:hypothetical protein